MLKIFVLFVRLLPYGQWAFGESRVQKYYWCAKNIRVIREIRVQKSRVQKIIIRVQNNLFVFKIQNSKFKTRITVPPDVPRPF